MKVLRKVERLDGTHLIRAIILMRTKSTEQWKLYKPEFSVRGSSPGGPPKLKIPVRNSRGFVL
jgi:hypothetical protein